LKRSNRLLFLIGIVLAIVAAVGVYILASGGGGDTSTSGPGGGTPIPEVQIVTARNEIAIGTIIEADMLNTAKKPQNEVPFDAISSSSAIAGLPARQTIPAGVPITLSMFQTQGSTSSKEILRALDPGFRAMAVQVDQVTGVGTIVQPGDRIDVVIAFEDTDGKFPIIFEGPASRVGTPPQLIRTFENFDDKLNNTSVKVLVQDAKVLGTLLPPPPAADSSGATPVPSTATGEVTLNGQQQIVILQLTPQQVELVRFAQLDGNLSLVLRAVRDRDQPPVPTTGITLFELVERWGVLPGQMTLQAPPPQP